MYAAIRQSHLPHSTLPTDMVSTTNIRWDSFWTIVRPIAGRYFRRLVVRAIVYFVRLLCMEYRQKKRT
jgi:hypothetical protein